MGRTSRVLVCGARRAGKTSLLERAIYGAAGPFAPTVEDIYVANVETERGTREKLRFLDTAGLDASSASSAPGGASEVPRHLHALADGYLVVYAVDDERSFQLAEAVVRDVERSRERKADPPPVVVLANKADLGRGRRVDATQALNWAAREKVKLFEVSALDRQSLHEPFVYLASRLNPPPNKSTPFSQLTIGRSKSGKPE